MIYACRAHYNVEHPHTHTPAHTHTCTRTQYIHDTLKYGTTKRDVEMALRDQKRRVDTIHAYKVNTLSNAQRNHVSTH